MERGAATTSLMMLLAGVAGLLGPLTSGPSAAGPVPAGPDLEPTNCSDCSGCNPQGEPGHLTSPDQSGAYYGSHVCLPAASCESHPLCSRAQLNPGRSTDDDRLVDLFEGAVLGHAESITTLLAEYPSLVRLNPERRALQLLGCKPEIVLGHLELSREQYASAATSRPLGSAEAKGRVLGNL